MKSNLILLTFIALFNCAPKNGKDQAPNQISSENKIPFPHPDNFKNIEQHGFWSLKDNSDGCKPCHGQDLKGLNSANSCFECHEFYPHTSWETKTAHGQIKKDNIKSQCAVCHSNDLNNKAPKKIQEKIPKCTLCHSYPHPADWLLAGKNEFHGNVALEKSNNDCQKCHGSDYRGVIKTGVVGCDKCHTEYPHTTDFKNQHHENNYELTENKISKKCQMCHLTRQLTENDQKPLYENKTCHNCHTYPHDSKWKDKLSNQFHGKFITNGNTTECQGCHGANLQGNGQQNKSCFNCHENYPHTSEWKTTSLHGRHYTSDLQLDKKNCHSCHGDKLTGSKTAPNCKNCHEYFPHSWASEREHGEVYIKNLESSFTFNCQICHGDDLLGGKSKVSCNSCHDVYPHPQFKYTNWTIPNNSHTIQGGYYNQPSKPCSNCHYDGMKKWKPLPKCYECHRQLKTLNSLPPESNFP